MIDGVVGVVGVPTGQLGGQHSAGGVTVSRTGITAVVVQAVPSLLKELAVIVAEYAQTATGVSTIAGCPMGAGLADGHALREAQLNSPSAAIVDDSDPLAGPQLIIAEPVNQTIRCLNLRMEQVTTIAGACRLVPVDEADSHVDGLARHALFSSPIALVIAPNGVIFVAEQVLRPSHPTPCGPPVLPPLILPVHRVSLLVANPHAWRPVAWPGVAWRGVAC
jgi:hypothetical protein